jgi:hypothetical protein
MKKIIIITTINVPNNLYDFRKLDRQKSWDYLVVGDKKTNHNEVSRICREVHGEYLSPDDQDKFGFLHSSALGWNCIERKNIGYLYALKEHYDIVGTIDDDNYPTDGWFESISLGPQQSDVISSDNGWFNPAEFANPPYKLRGFPIANFHTQPKTSIKTESVTVGVQAGLVVGDPDIDAISRIVNNPTITSYSKLDFCLDKGTMCPYNTQNTILDSFILPANMMWPDCGRYSDIFASYVGQVIAWKYGFLVKHGNPLAHQERNEHNLLLDLEQEILGMKVQESFFRALRDIELTGQSPADDLQILVHGIVDRIPQIPRTLKRYVDTWTSDIKKIGASRTR